MGKTQSYCYYMCEVIKNISDRLHDFFATLFYCSTTPFRYFFISLETVLVFLLWPVVCLTPSLLGNKIVLCAGWIPAFIADR